MEKGETGSTVDRIELHAPAKVNLGLEILRRRPDGYHDLNTVFATVDLYDTVTIARQETEGISCRVTGDRSLAAEPEGENLCTRAAQLVLREAGRGTQGVSIDLVKRIPTGAGLGGGSSDAAATLRGVSSLFAPDIEESRLHQLALSLGSDVPFFLLGRLAGAEGQGERLEPLDFELPWSILLVNPGIHVSTREAYRLVGREGERSRSDFVGLLRDAVRNPERLRTGLHNDFERSVLDRWPQIAELYGRIASTADNLHTGMSGSGATLFGVYAERGAAERAAGHFTEYFTHVGCLGRS